MLLDGEGEDLPDIEAVRKEAMATLPEIAEAEIATDGDTQNFVVIARDEAGTPVYTATLSYVGMKLADRPNTTSPPS